MILFVFEGKADKTYFEAIKRLFFPAKSETFLCTYNSNIYSLYTKLKSHDALKEMLEVDTVSVLKEILLEKGDETLKDIREDEVSEIYLFFDYDFQEDSRTLEENNSRLSELLGYFTDETGRGKLLFAIPKNCQTTIIGNIPSLARGAKKRTSNTRCMSSPSTSQTWNISCSPSSPQTTMQRFSRRQILLRPIGCILSR